MQTELLVQALQDRGLKAHRDGPTQNVVAYIDASNPVPKSAVTLVAGSYGGRCTYEKYGPNTRVYIRPKASR